MFCWRMKNEWKLFVWQFWIVDKKIFFPSFLGLLSLFVSAAGANMVATLNSAVYCVTCIVLGIFLSICPFFSLNDLNLIFIFPFVSFVTKFQQSKSTVSMVEKERHVIISSELYSMLFQFNVKLLSKAMQLECNCFGHCYFVVFIFFILKFSLFFCYSQSFCCDQWFFLFIVIVSNKQLFSCRNIFLSVLLFSLEHNHRFTQTISLIAHKHIHTRTHTHTHWQTPSNSCQEKIWYSSRKAIRTSIKTETIRKISTQIEFNSMEMSLLGNV